MQNIKRWISLALVVCLLAISPAAALAEDTETGTGLPAESETITSPSPSASAAAESETVTSPSPSASAAAEGESITSPSPSASTAAEDETNLSKVSCSMELFELYVKGFLEGCAGSLTPKEVELLPMGAKVMTYECGMRFLTDYLEGDHYFKIHREGHNLDRARTQFKLVADMEKKWDTMKEIIRRYGSL